MHIKIQKYAKNMRKNYLLCTKKSIKNYFCIFLNFHLVHIKKYYLHKNPTFNHHHLSPSVCSATRSLFYVFYLPF
jgi:hypothetical protein